MPSKKTVATKKRALERPKVLDRVPVLKKRTVGRPKKAESDKLEQFSIRLPPKLKLGLELLSRAQNRSLSQAVEWALQVGLNSYRVNNDWENVAGLLDKVWEKDEGFDRLWVIYCAAPNLLSFDDRSACEVIDGSYEHELADEYLGSKPYVKSLPEDQQADAHHQMQNQRQQIFFGFVSSVWKLIRERAISYVNSGKLPQGARLMHLLDLEGPSMVDPFARMLSLTESMKNDFKDESGMRILRLDNELPWSRNRGRFTDRDFKKLEEQKNLQKDSE